MDQRTLGGDIIASVLIPAAVTNPNFRQIIGSGGCVGIYAAGDTTPSVAQGVSQLIVANASATSITTLDDADNGQLVSLKFSDANTTLVNSTSLRLQGGADFVSSDRDVMALERVSGAWYERSRSLN